MAPQRSRGSLALHGDRDREPAPGPARREPRVHVARHRRAHPASRASSNTRRSTTPSRVWPTVCCSRTVSSMPWSAWRGLEAASPCSSWTSTTSSWSTTATGTCSGTSSSCRSPSGSRRILRSSDTAARLGGDEFAILLEGAADTRRSVRRCRAGPRALRGELPARLGRALDLGQHRRRALGRLSRVGAGTASRRRRGHVLGEGTRQGPPRGVRAGDAGGRLRASRARERAAPGGRERRVRRPLPADHRHRHRAHRRDRGPGALEPPPSGPPEPGLVHSSRGRDRPDPAHRRIRPRSRLPPALTLGAADSPRWDCAWP